MGFERPSGLQAGPHLTEAPADEVLGGIALHALTQDDLGDLDGGVGGGGADLGRGLDLGLGDLGLGRLRPAGDEIVQAGVALVGDALSLMDKLGLAWEALDDADEAPMALHTARSGMPKGRIAYGPRVTGGNAAWEKLARR